MRIMRELKQQEEGQNQPGRGLFFGNSPATIGAYPMFITHKLATGVNYLAMS